MLQMSQIKELDGVNYFQKSHRQKILKGKIVNKYVQCRVRTSLTQAPPTLDIGYPCACALGYNPIYIERTTIRP